MCLPAYAETFFDLGASATRVESRIANTTRPTSRNDSGLHVGLGARRTIGERSDIGVRIELDNVNSNLLLAVRALDYRYHLSDRIALGGFIGAARLDLGTPAYGYYLGIGVHFKEVLERWDLSVDLRNGNKVARDNVLPTDPQGGQVDNFHDITGVTIVLSRSF